MQGGNAQNKKRFIIVSLILILSLALPCFATVTESSGDGFALYNGVKLLDVSSVWDQSSSFPFAFLFYNNENLPVLYVFESRPWISTTVERVMTNNGYSAYMVSNGSWSLVENYGSAGERTLIPHSWVFWSSFDLGYSSNPSSSDTPFLAASTPIPLDGMEVIEWDGDLDDAISYASYNIKLGDYFPVSSALAVYRSGDDRLLGTNFSVVSEASSSGWYVLSSDGDMFAAGIEYEPSFPSGLYFSYHQSDSYTQLFAYRESETEGPTGAVTGLTITYPPVGESDFIAYAGSDIQCAATVTGTGDFNPAVTWSVQYSAEYNPDVYPTISETGLLHLPSTMLEQRIVVVATSVEDPSIGAIVPIYIMPPAVSSVTITPSSATAAPGQNVQFSATVSGSNVEDSAVTWAVGGASSSSTRITRDGLLLIGSDEVSPVIAVRATSDQDGSVYGTALVTINIPAAVTGVTITPDDIVLNRGDLQQFTATVSGTGSYDNSVTWQITSVYSAGTSISNTGLLTIGEEQKYDYIIIKATSTADPSLSASAYVFVEDAISDPMNIDLSVLERLLEEIKNYLKTLQHIFDRPHYFREFNMYTGKLNEQDEQITGLTFNFYRFMQNMEEYVGSIAYTFANGAEVQIREDTTEGFDWFSLFFGKDSGSKVEKSDFAGISTIVTNTRDLFDTGFGFSDFFELIGSVPFFTNEVGSQLDTTVSYFDVRDPDPFNMSVLGNRDEQLEEWRNKHTD